MCAPPSLLTNIRDVKHDSRAVTKRITIASVAETKERREGGRKGGRVSEMSMNNCREEGRKGREGAREGLPLGHLAEGNTGGRDILELAIDL